MTQTYDRIRSVLAGYLNPLMVDTLLAVACRKAGESPQTLGPQHLEAVLSELSHAIRLYCPAEQFSKMMLELAAIAG